MSLCWGELDATPGVASSVVKQNPEFLEKGLMDFHAIVEIPRGDKHPRFAQLPELDSFVKSDKERKLLALHRTFRLAGSPFILPPGTPKDRADILREAMRKIYADREFLAEYLKLTGEEASPLLPDANDKAIKELPRDPEVIEFYKLLGGTQAAASALKMVSERAINVGKSATAKDIECARRKRRQFIEISGRIFTYAS